MRRKSSTQSAGNRGLTLLEMTIGALIAGLLSVGAYKLMTLFFTDPNTVGTSQTTAASVDEFTGILRREWRAREAPDAFVAAPSTAFSAGSGAAPCSGIKITQMQADGSTRSVTVETVCQSAKLQGQLPKAHPDLACGPGQAPVVKIVRNPGNSKQYPSSPEVVAMAACFRVTAAGAAVEIGAVGLAGRRHALSLSPLFLSALDRSSTVKIFAN